MSDNQYDELFNEDETTEVETETGPKALRTALAKEKKRNEDLQSRLAELETKTRQSEIEKALSAAGLPAAAAKFAVRDVTDPTEIDTWIEENRGLFGGAGETTVKEVEQDFTQKGEPTLTPEQRREIESTQQVQVGSTSAMAERDAKTDAVFSRGKRVEDIVAELNALNRKAAQG